MLKRADASLQRSSEFLTREALPHTSNNRRQYLPAPG